VDERSLPLTGQQAAQRIITDLRVLDVTGAGAAIRLVELAPGISSGEVKAATQPEIVDATGGRA
jgi:3-oxoacid CoA-transferase subunit B